MQNAFANFSLTLINTKQKQYLMLGWWIIALNGLVSLFAAYAAYPDKQRSLIVLGLLTPLLIVLINGRWGTKKKGPSQQIRFFLIFMTSAWWANGFYLPGSVLLLLLLLFTISLRPLQVRFCEQGIEYPSFPKKLIGWNNVTQAIVKDDLLTIDLRSNKLIQQPIEKSSFIDDRELQEFNGYCQQKIKNP